MKKNKAIQEVLNKHITGFSHPVRVLDKSYYVGSANYLKVNYANNESSSDSTDKNCPTEKPKSFYIVGLDKKEAA